jgi:hypothetical protein
LTLLNGEFPLEQAEQWGRRLSADLGSRRLTAEQGSDTTAIIRTVWQAAFGREPGEAEVAKAMDFLRQQTETLAATSQPGVGTPPAEAALVDFCHAIFNANEFLYID